MSAAVASPRETAAAIGETGGATYVDVRTVEEFVGGRPVGRVVNVPLEFYHPTTAAVHDNAAFELVCQHALDAGGRSLWGETTAAVQVALLSACLLPDSVMCASWRWVYLPGWRKDWQ